MEEDGVPQEITSLWTEVDLPLTVALVLDVSSSQMGFVKAHRHSAERFVTRVIGPADRALIATVDEQPRLLLALTSSSRELSDGVNRLGEERHTGQRFGEACVPPGRSSRRRGHGCMGTAIWDGVFHLTREFLPLEGRKALVLLSDGLDLKSSVHGLTSAIEAAQSRSVAVYTIKYLSGPYLALSPVTGVQAARDHGMQQIADQTGGLAFHHPKNLDDVFARIEEDLRSQYVAAFAPKSSAGQWHRLRIRASRPGVTVRAQAGYRIR